MKALLFRRLVTLFLFFSSCINYRLIHFIFGGLLRFELHTNNIEWYERIELNWIESGPVSWACVLQTFRGLGQVFQFSDTGSPFSNRSLVYFYSIPCPIDDSWERLQKWLLINFVAQDFNASKADISLRLITHVARFSMAELSIYIKEHWSFLQDIKTSSCAVSTRCNLVDSILIFVFLSKFPLLWESGDELRQMNDKWSSAESCMIILLRSLARCELNSQDETRRARSGRNWY